MIPDEEDRGKLLSGFLDNKNAPFEGEEEEEEQKAANEDLSMTIDESFHLNNSTMVAGGRGRGNARKSTRSREKELREKEEKRRYEKE